MKVLRECDPDRENRGRRVVEGGKSLSNVEESRQVTCWRHLLSRGRGQGLPEGLTPAATTSFMALMEMN